MEQEAIDEIASAIAQELEAAEGRPDAVVALYRVTERIAGVINSENETYDMRYFYRAAGYPEPYPYHEMH